MILLPFLTIISSILSLAQIVPPAPRTTPEQSELPAWTAAERAVTADGEIFTVLTADFSNHRDATLEIYPAAREAISTWAVQNFGTDEIGITLSDEVIDKQFVYRERILVPTFREEHGPEKASKLGREFDVFYRGYLQICITPEFRESLNQTLDRDVVQRRLFSTLTAGIFCFGTLGVLWCYLRAMQLTRGFYRSRLRWIAAAMLLVVLLACYAVSQFC